jgi:phage terminase large subunit-like protein
MLKLTDDFYGKPFILPEWQYKVIWDVYGTLNDNGYRQYNYAYLEIPKKNGKTTLIAALAVMHLTLDPEEGQIYCCAADRGQAELVYKAAVSMIEQDTELEKIFKITDSKKEILNKITGTKMKVLSAEAYTKHGINPTVVIFDELHAQPNRNLWDVMTFGAGAARKEPLWWVITTAGDDPDRHSIGWEVHEQARKIIEGEQTDPSWYAKIYCAPENADIYDEATWYMANPSLGQTISIESVRKEAIAARNSDGAEKLFKWLRLNQWVSLKDIGWLPLTLWDSTVGEWNIAELTGKKCYMGLDLSSKRDLTACALLFPPQPGIDDWRAIFEAWIPDSRMKERIENDKAPFDKWVKQKFIHATSGDAVDYDFIEARIIALSKQYKIEYIGTDPWNSTMLSQHLNKNGIESLDVDQTMSGMSPGMKEIERMMLRGLITHELNPVARWCFGNIVIAEDGNENIKPMKNRSKDRIDVIVALIDAMNIAMRFEQVGSYYENHNVKIG